MFRPYCVLYMFKQDYHVCLPFTRYIPNKSSFISSITRDIIITALYYTLHITLDIQSNIIAKLVFVQCFSF